MKALILGAGGQLGRQLLANAPQAWTCVAPHSAQLDITDEDAVWRTVAEHQPDVIVNAAAYTAVDRAEAERETAFAVNASAVGTLAGAAAACGAHLVHVSSDFVFDGDTSRAYRPTDPRHPLSVYGHSKAAGEDAAGSAATIVRTSWVYAAGSGNFVTTMLRLLRDRGEVAVVCDQIGSPTWAKGLAETIWALADRRIAGTWHHCDAGVASWFDLAVAIAEEAVAQGLLAGPVEVTPITTAEYPTPARRPAFSVLDASATRDALGLAPVHWRVNLRKMLKQASAAES